MTIKVDITPEMQRRLSEIARSSRRSESQLISAALENGHALEWQERFTTRIRQGIEAADRGDFVTVREIDQVGQKYRPA